MKNLKSKLNPEKLAPLLDKLLQFARITEILARRSLGLVRGFALMGLLAAVWLAYSTMAGLHLSLLQTLMVLLILALPSMVLGKLYVTLQDTLDLPARLVDAIAKLKDKSKGAWQGATELKAKAATQKLKPRFSNLLDLGRAALELKDYGDEAFDIIAVVSETLMLVNPLFLLMTALAGTAIIGEILFGLGLGWLHLR